MKGCVRMSEIRLLVLFGGVSPEHEVSLRSAESILSTLNKTRYRVFPVGITKEGKWLLYQSQDYSRLPRNTWQELTVPAVFSPVRGEGLLIQTPQGLERETIDVILPVLHGENGEDGSIQGLAQLAGIPCVGCGVAASATCMDKSLTKLVADQARIRQAAWELVTRRDMDAPEAVRARIEARFAYPVFVKPAGTGSSVGVTKVRRPEDLMAALEHALQYDRKALVEEFIHGREIECAVLGNEAPMASICGEIDSGAEFYDYDAKYLTDTAQLYIPGRISQDAMERVRKAAVQVYLALGCRGLSRVDFFVTYEEEEVVFNEINTLPGFTSISMYPKLMEASGVPYPELLDRLVDLAMEAQHG